MNLTKPQETVWQMEQFTGKAISVICGSMLKMGNKDEDSLRKAVKLLFQHNDALRTRLCVKGLDVEQYVSPDVPGNIPVFRFPGISEMKEYAEQYAKLPMDVSGPLCEISILMLPDRYGLLVKVHHIISDAWTMALLATQFNMFLEGKQPRCGSYQSYFEREKNYLNSGRYSRDRDFFLNLVSCLEEPVLISDQRTDTLKSERECFFVARDFAESIREFAQGQNTTVYSAFMTVLACYISRTNANAEKVFVGTTVLNRIDEMEMHTAGMYANAVPVLVTLRKDRSFRECIEETEDMLMSVFRHQRYNYTQLQNDLAKERLFSGRLYDVTLHYLNAAVENPNSETELIWHHNGIQNESLQIHIDDRNSEGVFCITYDYQTAKFSAEEIKKLHGHLMNMLCDGIQNPHKGCHNLCMLSGEEERKIRFEFNNTAKTYCIPKDATVSSLFEANAEKNLDKPCIFIDGNSLTYGDFLRQSRNIDAEIRRRTNSQKTVVAVIAERSAEMYSALYGIIRGGNAYLPILPDTPKERVNYILKNSGASLVLAQSAFVELVEDISCIDLSESFPEPEIFVSCAAQPQDTAYVMYTSGSTGRPKGVEISHEAVINRILWMNDVYPLGDDGVILQKTVYGFDVSVWEIFWWGMCGGAMAVSLPGEHAVPSKILNEVYRNKVTHLHFVPSVFELFLNYLESNEKEQYKFDAVKHVFLSGEKLESVLVNRFYMIYDYRKVQIHNLYGPTECAVDVTAYDCVPDESTVPIGRPIYNTQIYITDQNLNLLPLGIRGELVIGGRNVGKGYINDPELTRERFVDNPFGEGSLYKTGDLAYLREDGQFIFCDRIDMQVKINGQRVEPAEVEMVVKSVPSVDAAAVVVREEGGRKLLLAYYSGCAPADDVIIAECAKKLPKHMIPQPIQIDHIPLHPNGKLDRKKLEERQIELPEGANIEPPANEIEKHICEAFCRVLSLKTVGRNSDFFSLGGDSLGIISFLVESGYDQITAAQFIGNPTPAKLASLIMAGQKNTMKYVQTIYKPEIVSKAYVLFPFAGGDAESYTNLARSVVQQDDTVALYYVPYLHKYEECEVAAEEIVELTKESKVCFYSHCAGAAVAVCVLREIEQRYGAEISHFYAAGIVPHRTCFAFNLWNCVPDKALLSILKKAGAPKKLLYSENVADILERFRKDTDFAARIFFGRAQRCSCATTLLLGRGDLFTRFIGGVEKRWSKYVQHIEQIHFLETENHYFHSTESDTVARLMLSECQTKTPS